jgi:hypothetical protein
MITKYTTFNLKETATPFLLALFQFFKNSDFDVEYEGTNREHFDKTKDLIKKKMLIHQDFVVAIEEFIKDWNFPEKDDFYSSDDSASLVDMFQISFDFGNFLIFCKNTIENYEPAFLDFKGSVRQASPPIEAYGFSKSELKQINFSRQLGKYNYLFDD